MGLEEDKITWHSNSRAWLVTYAGLEEDKITWHSNACYTLLPVWKKIKLHGTQTVWRSCTVDRMFWKRKKLQGSQTVTRRTSRKRTFWKRKKLHGSQTEMVHLYCAAKTKKLQGTQTPIKHSAVVLELWRRVNCMVLKHTLHGRTRSARFEEE